MTLSTLVLLTLGVLHLIYTFSGPKLLPRDPTLQARMNEVNLVITRQTTVWRAWIGFNASPSGQVMWQGGAAWRLPCVTRRGSAKLCWSFHRGPSPGTARRS